MNEPKFRQKLTQARQFEATFHSVGFQEVLMPRLKGLFEEADIKCHDIRARDDHGKYYIGVYQGFKKVFDEIEAIQREGRSALKWLKDNNVDIE